MSEIIQEGGVGLALAFLLLLSSLLWSAALALIQGFARWRIPAPLWLAPSALLLALAGAQWLVTTDEVYATLNYADPTLRYKLAVIGFGQAARSASAVALMASLSAAAAGAALGLATALGAGPDARWTPPQLAAAASSLLLLPAPILGMYALWPADLTLLASAALASAMLCMCAGAARCPAAPADASRAAAARLTLAALATTSLAAIAASHPGLILGALSLNPPPTIEHLASLDAAITRAVAAGAASAALAGLLLALSSLGLPERPRGLLPAAASALLLIAAPLPLLFAASQHAARSDTLPAHLLSSLPQLPPAPAQGVETPGGAALIYDQRGTLKHALLDPRPRPGEGCPPAGADLVAPLCRPLRAPMIAIAPDQHALRLSALALDDDTLKASLLVHPAPASPLTWLVGAERLTLRAVQLRIDGPARWHATDDHTGIVTKPTPGDGRDRIAETINVVVAGEVAHLDGLRLTLAQAAARPSRYAAAIVATPDLTVATLIARCAALAAPGQCHLIPALPAGFPRFAQAEPGQPAPPPADKEAILGELLAADATDMRDVVRSVMLRNMSSLRSCYEQALRTKPSLEGVVSVKFTINAQGAVAATSISPASSLDDLAVTACIIDKIKAISFPKPPGGEPVTIHYPLVFRSAQ